MKGLALFGVIVAVLSLAVPPLSNSNNAFAADECTLMSVHDLVHEIEHNRAYVQVHTDDTHAGGNATENTGPGDLFNPGEVRGQIVNVTSSEFQAILNATNEVIHHLPMHEQHAWNTVTAMGVANFTLHGDPHHPNMTTDHIEYSIEFNPGINNVVGLHIHNGEPTENNSVHLVDIIASDKMSPVDYGPGVPITGEIRMADLCPSGHGHGGHDDGGSSECTATIAHLVNEMTHNRTYVQFHTNDGHDPTNTGPGDLASPGEVRGDITQASMHQFIAHANKTQNVFAHDADQTPWTNVTAHADLTFNEMNHGQENHHVMFNFTIHDLENVVGIHIHNGAPGESNSLHLADILTESSSLITGINHGPQNLDGIYTGMITAADMCPAGHGGHDHGGSDDGGTASGSNPLPSTVILAGHVMQEDDYLPLIDFGNSMVEGNLQLRIPCNADGLPLVLPVAGHVDFDPAQTHVETVADLNLIQHMSTLGKTCVYQSVLPAHDAGAEHITSIGLMNTCDRNVVFRTSNVMSFTLHEVLGNINDSPYSDGPILPETGDITVQLHDGHVEGNVCGLSSGTSDGGHDDGDHDHS